MQNKLIVAIYNYIKKLLIIILLALVAATLFKVFFIQFYIVPTPSMEPTIPVGNGVILSKMHYGPRIKGIFLPGFSSIKRNDIAIFEYPVNHKQLLIKRCIGLPGETIYIKHNRVFINNCPILEAKSVSFSYSLKYKTYFAISNIKPSNGPKVQQDTGTLIPLLNESDASKLKENKAIGSIEKLETNRPDNRIFPGGTNKGWNRYNFGPVTIPKKGVKIALTDTNIMLYRKTIETSENNLIIIKNKVCYINAKPATYYVFKKDYYFMMGDNRHNSIDSRFWGFIAEDKIIGKAIYTVNLTGSIFSEKERFIKSLY